MEKQVNIVSDIGTLLRIPTKVTTEIADKACLCIGSAIAEAKLSGEQITTVNIGIGQLSVDLVDMQCKFIPSKNLKAAIKQALTSNVDPMELMIEQAFTNKLLALCEEVI